jgi:predicted acetyltransferase
VDLQIVDPDAPWNAGRWVLEASDGEASLRPGGDGTVEATIGGLSALWAGYAPARALATAGLLRTSDAGALDALDDVFAGPPPALLDFY